jgi:hypothetical protein
MKRIKQIFHHYSKWEDYKHGLYDSSCDYFDEKLNLSCELLRNEDDFYRVATDCLSKWKFSAEQNLSDYSINYQAYIGQASCCFNHKAPFYVTIQAWWMLSDDQRSKANAVADKVFREWQIKKQNKGSLWESVV